MGKYTPPFLIDRIVFYPVPEKMGDLERGVS
jgi:hypothetical protein